MVANVRERARELGRDGDQKQASPWLVWPRLWMENCASASIETDAKRSRPPRVEMYLSEHIAGFGCNVQRSASVLYRSKV
ncbi:MAG: hypothetical protein EAZ61_05980 [Oscillatoriales cyanobacterium]|nr:MAG: hypothetical protein EAZ61_05980 [Oscillatoriales cyanobacterium]